MVTITEALGSLEKEKQEQVVLNPSKFVYNTPSGTKDIQVRWQIGGRAVKIKKVFRNPQPIFGMDEISFESPESATSRTLIHKKPIAASSGVVNIEMDTKIRNIDTRGSQAQAQKVYGMYKIGGAGIKYAEGDIQQLNELKLLKQETRIEVMQRQKEQAQGRWKGGL